MAVQQNKKSPSKRGMHRAHDFLGAAEPVTGETHRRHHISPSGYYRGKKVVKTKADDERERADGAPHARTIRRMHDSHVTRPAAFR